MNDFLAVLVGGGAAFIASVPAALLLVALLRSRPKPGSLERPPSTTVYCIRPEDIVEKGDWRRI